MTPVSRKPFRKASTRNWLYALEAWPIGRRPTRGILLCMRRQRPCRHPAPDQRDKFTTFHAIPKSEQAPPSQASTMKGPNGTIRTRPDVRFGVRYLVQLITSLFDHFVRADKYRRWHVQAKGFRHPQVDY